MSVRAGASVRDITPQEPVRLARRTGDGHVSTGIRDPLLVSAIHLRGGAGGIMILSLDLLSLSPSVIRRIRQQIVETTGTHAQNIMVATTQNHAGPVVGFDLYPSVDKEHVIPDEAYVEHVVNQSVQAASEAAVASVPAEVAVLRLAEPHTGVALIKNGRNNRIMAAIIVCGEIPDFLGPDNTEISSDFVHTARERLAARFGHSPVLGFFVGPSGGRAATGSEDRGKTKDARESGKGLADQVLSKVKALAAKDFLSNLSFAGKIAEVPEINCGPLPNKHDAETALSAAMERLAGLEKEGASSKELDIAQQAVAEARSRSAFVSARDSDLLTQIVNAYSPTEIQVLCLGPTRLLCMPGLVDAECGRDLAHRAGAQLWVVEGVNGDMLGSVLTGSGEGGSAGYVLRSTIFEPETGKAMVDVAMSLLTA